MGLGGSQGWVRQGDPAEGGGEVTGASGFLIGGKPLMRVGDMARCDTHGGSFPVVQGDDGFIVDGRPVVLDKHRLACGCRPRLRAVLPTPPHRRVGLRRPVNRSTTRRSASSVRPTIRWRT